MRLRSLALLPVLAAVVGGGLAAPAAASPEAKPYIVVLKDDVSHPSDVAAEHRRKHGAAVTHTYAHALKGYAAELTASAYGEVMRDPRVKYVEPDGVVTASDLTQPDATWGLSRIDQRTGYDSLYTHPADTATAVIAYVIDSGINTKHAEFEGRARPGFDAFPASAEDCNGHGTHVAGTIGGKTYGVAKGVQLVSVRVLDCNGSGSWQGVIAGIDWAVGHHPTTKLPAVANMSLGGGANTAVDDAVKRLIGVGVPTVVAAGNGNAGGRAQDACNYSPARVPTAMTIGATDQTDTKTSWSNYGSCVDWFAPGYQITSAWHTSTTATNTISGTSMAAPHVAGVAAIRLSQGTSQIDVAELLREATTKGIVKSANTTANHLLYLGSAPPLEQGATDGSGGGTKGGGPKK